MAISYIDVKDEYEKKMNSPLSQHELSAVAEIEKIIDNKILKNFDDGELMFSIRDVNFNTFHQRRSKLMFSELERRYKSVGWKTRIYSTDDDGPNRPSFTYWVLFGK